MGIYLCPATTISSGRYHYFSGSGALSTRVAIVIDNMYLQNALHTFGIKALDMAKLPGLLIDEERNEEYHTTHVFDALPFVPKENPKPFQMANRDKKRKYLDKLQYLDRVKVYEGKVWQKHIICPKCNQPIEVAVQKLVDVKISVVLLRLSLKDSGQDNPGCRRQ